MFDSPLFLVGLASIGIVTGLAGGLFGIGGGTIIVPSLILCLGFTQVAAQGTSLVAMLMPVGLLGVLRYRKAGIFNYKASMIIALGLFFGAFPGAKLALALPTVWLKACYALFLLWVALKFIDPKGSRKAFHEWLEKERERKRKKIFTEIESTPIGLGVGALDQTESDQKHSFKKAVSQAVEERVQLRETNRKWYWLFFVGLLGGIAAGFFGIGGGAIIIPFLTFVLHYDHQEARVISLGALDPPVGILGLIPYMKGGHVHLATAAPVALGMMIGSYFGAWIGVSIPKRLVKFFYGFFLLWMVGYYCYQIYPLLLS